jgi:hypothetical protein
MLQEIAEHQGLPTEKYRFLLKACPPFSGWLTRRHSGGDFSVSPLFYHEFYPFLLKAIFG